MPVINVIERFMIRADENAPLVEYLPGSYEVSEALATHWYVVAHTDAAETAKAPPQPVTSSLLVEQAVRMATSVRAQEAAPPPPPPGTVAAEPLAQPGSTARQEVYFAGTPRPETQLSLLGGPPR